MKKITQEKLDYILRKHKLWVTCKVGGEKADLSGMDLSGMDLSGMDLSGALLDNASLNGASLVCASLNDASLNGASLVCALLDNASLNGASLNRASLVCASLNDASLNDASLNGASLNGASLVGASLNGASLNRASLNRATNIPYIPMACPEDGEYIGYKKCDNHIVKLRIPADARRSSATGRKCRSDKAEVLSITTLDGTDDGFTEIASDCDKSFVYRVGEIVSVQDFCENRFRECAPGIHHFINRREAVEYQG